MSQRWEYQFIEVYIARGDGEDVLGWRVQAAGEEGWELVAVTPLGNEGCTVRLYFKRPL